MHERNAKWTRRKAKAWSRSAKRTSGAVSLNARRFSHAPSWRTSSSGSSGLCRNSRTFSAKASTSGWAAMSSSSLGIAPGRTASSSDSSQTNVPLDWLGESQKLASHPTFSGRRTERSVTYGKSACACATTSGVLSGEALSMTTTSTVSRISGVICARSAPRDCDSSSARLYVGIQSESVGGAACSVIGTRSPFGLSARATTPPASRARPRATPGASVRRWPCPVPARRRG